MYDFNKQNCDDCGSIKDLVKSYTGGVKCGECHKESELKKVMAIPMSPEYERHKLLKKKCDKLDRSYGSDWNTCLHKDNPTEIQICSPEHCPRKGDECYI